MKFGMTVAAFCVPMTVLAAQPRLDDYASGMAIDAPPDRPIVEIVLPDAVYLGTTRTDLADVRVFNRDGNAVSHAVCSSDVALAPTITREPMTVFQMQAAVKSADGTRVDVRTAGGTQVAINEAAGANSTTEAAPGEHVIDARTIMGELRAIEFDWSSPDGASEVRVQIQSSEDLDTWQTVVAGSTLLQVTEGTAQLRRHTIPLVQRRYSYLRVRRVDAGPALSIDSARAEVVARPVAIDPVWFIAETDAATEPRSLVFSSQRLAPISYARLRLADSNSSVRVTIGSRDNDKASWRGQWNGEFYSIMAGSTRRGSPPAEFPVTWDRHWRVEPVRPGDPFYETTVLELGYRPAKLRFLAQGPGPFTLAYGSRRAEPAPAQSCDRLLADLNAKDLADLIGQSSATASRSLGGETALKPLPRKTPLRLMVLWGVLVAGVGLLIAMAASLFKRLKS